LSISTTNNRSEESNGCVIIHKNSCDRVGFPVLRSVLYLFYQLKIKITKCYAEFTTQPPNGTSLKFSTVWKIKTKILDDDAQRARETRQFEKHGELNTLLKNLSNEVADAHRKLINDKTPVTHDQLKVALNQFLQKDKNKNHTDIVSFAESWVESIDRKKNTKKQLRQAIRNLKEFKRAARSTLHFDTINLEPMYL